jgi:hypothetical protein
MQKTELRKIMVPGQLGKKSFCTPSQSREGKLGIVVHTCHTSYHGKHKIKGLWSRLAKAKSKSLSPK